MKKVDRETKRTMLMALLHLMDYHDIHESEQGYGVYGRHHSVTGTTRHRMPDFMDDDAAAMRLAIDHGVFFVFEKPYTNVLLRTVTESGCMIAAFVPVEEHDNQYAAVRYGIIKILLLKMEEDNK